MARRKVIMQVRELTEMEVEKLSLVKRGANRVPFRITKSDGDSDMQFNLDNLFLLKRETVLPALIAVAIADVKHSQLIIDALKKEGIDIDHVNQEEGSESATLMLGKDDELPEDVVAYKLGDHAAMLFTGIKKGLISYPDTGDFIENINTAGFIPSFRIAAEVLMDTVRNILYEEGDADVTKSAVKKALGDFKGYVEAVMSTVPVNAFKAEKAIMEVEKGMLLGQGINDKSGSGDAVHAGRATAMDTASDTAIAKAKAKDGDSPRTKDEYSALGEKAGAKAGKAFDSAMEASDDSGADDSGADADADDDAAEGGEGGDDAGDDSGKASPEANAGDDAGDDAGSADDQGTEAITKAIAALNETLEGMNLSINKKIDEVKGGLDKRLDAMDEQVKKNEEAIEGTVHSGSAEDDDSTQVVKDDGEPSFEDVLDFGDVEQN